MEQTGGGLDDLIEQPRQLIGSRQLGGDPAECRGALGSDDGEPPTSRSSEPISSIPNSGRLARALTAGRTAAAS